MTGHYFQDWLLLDTDWNWRLEPDKGGALRAVGDIGSHWLDLMTFVTGQPIVSVMADLATFVELRQEPTRAGRDVLDGALRRHGRAPDGDRGRRVDPAPLRATAPAARSRVSQISAGRKNSLQWEIDGSDGAAAWDSETPDHLWLGHRDRPERDRSSATRR